MKDCLTINPNLNLIDLKLKNVISLPLPGKVKDYRKAWALWTVICSQFNMSYANSDGWMVSLPNWMIGSKLLKYGFTPSFKISHSWHDRYMKENRATDS